MNLFDSIKAIYQKTKEVPADLNGSILLTLNKWLGHDTQNLQYIKRLIPFVFYVEPKHYYYLLFFSIPKKNNVPFFKMPKKEEEKEDKLLDKIQYVTGWSNRELKFNKKILDKTVLNDRKFWERELAIC